MSGDGYFQDGDQLSEGNLGKALLADNNKDYVDRGGGITGPSNGDITVEAGQVFIEDTASEQLYKVYPPEATLTLPNASGDNYVYATFDPATQDSAQWEITDTQGSGLTNPVRLLRAVVDGGAATVDLRNDAPSGTFESVNTDGLVIGGELYTHDGEWSVSSQISNTYSMSVASDSVIIIPDQTAGVGFDEYQINGTTSNYVTNEVDGASSTSSQFGFPFTHNTEYISLWINNSDNLSASCITRNGALGGRNPGIGSPISQITGIDSGGISRSLTAQIYRRDMS